MVTACVRCTPSVSVDGGRVCGVDIVVSDDSESAASEYSGDSVSTYSRDVYCGRPDSD